MQRLLMGEVGSGKTVVALFALLRAVEHGRQGAFMAPTETLAEQHFRTVQELLPGELVRVALLTGSTPAARRNDILAKLASGELELIVGTHALIEPAVAFSDLAVVVVDEQHRFGVRQRAAPGRQGPGRAAPARPAHDRDADPAHAGADRLRRPRRHGPARAAPRPPADHHAPGHERSGARPRLRAHPRGAAGRAPGLRRLPARRRVRHARSGARGRGRVGGAAHRRAPGLLASACSTGRCRPRRSRR